MSEYVVTTEIALQSLIGDLRQAYQRDRFLRVRVRAGKARSLDQNAISHAWYEQMAREDRQYDALGHKCYCKLHHAVPIMRAEEADFREAYDAAIKGLSYEQKLLVMRLLPVTSLMTKDQLSRYLEAVQADYGSRGVLLQFPEAA